MPTLGRTSAIASSEGRTTFSVELIRGICAFLDSHQPAAKAREQSRRGREPVRDLISDPLHSLHVRPSTTLPVFARPRPARERPTPTLPVPRARRVFDAALDKSGARLRRATFTILESVLERAAPGRGTARPRSHRRCHTNSPLNFTSFTCCPFDSPTSTGSNDPGGAKLLRRASTFSVAGMVPTIPSLT